MHVDDDVACLHVERNKLVGASYLDIKDKRLTRAINHAHSSNIKYA